MQTPSQPQKISPYAYSVSRSRESDAQEVANEQKRCYNSKGWAVEEYRYPFTASLSVEIDGRPVRMSAPMIGGQLISSVRARAKRIVQDFPSATVYITIPSKANHDTND